MLDEFGQPQREMTPGLVLTGGGARAAYQVGVLKAMAEWLPPGADNPFPVITGASAGSLNAMLLGSRVQDFRSGVAHLERLWSNLSVDMVFRTDTKTMLKTTAQWLAWLVMLRSPRFAPKALLDNSPLRKVLESHVNIARVQQAIDSGKLDALAVTASGYSSGRSVSFFQGRHGLVSWSRTRRDGKMTELTLDHLMASIALPIIFPAVQLGEEYFGDGSMRQAAPLSPAIHLGADRLLVIGMRNEDVRSRRRNRRAEYPTFGEIGGYILDSLFMDSLYTDIERMRRINELVRQLGGKPRGAVKPLREIDVSVMVPSEDIRDIALRHLRELPRTLKIMLRLLGANRRRGSQLVSYLLFDGGYCGELIRLGYRDANERRLVLEPFVPGAAEHRRREGEQPEGDGEAAAE
ncbi:MAG: patatin-like phospholipase family protein [Gammaproteobacteria bacterium]|nr:patatin-like phospholipase family protein [Gammaproteobacteria bacterium]